MEELWPGWQAEMPVAPTAVTPAGRAVTVAMKGLGRSGRHETASPPPPRGSGATVKRTQSSRGPGLPVDSEGPAGPGRGRQSASTRT
jgi:hypothetical protein